jgi:hypothetical protein
MVVTTHLDPVKVISYVEMRRADKKKLTYQEGTSPSHVLEQKAGNTGRV